VAEFDHGIKIIAGTTGRQLARLAGVECREWEPLESTLQATAEFLADAAGPAAVYRLLRVLHDLELPRPVEYAGEGGPPLLSQREELPTVCLAFVFLPRGYVPQHGHFRLEAAGGPTQELWFREVCLWQLEPQDWWEQVPGLMTLYPLCRHRRRPQEAIELAAETIERTVSDPAERGDDLFLLNIFGGLAYPRLDVAGIIGREKMRESRYSRELRAEERLATRRLDVLKVLSKRFGPASRADIEAALGDVTDFDELGQLLLLAADCVSLNDFRKSLPKQRAGR